MSLQFPYGAQPWSAAFHSSHMSRLVNMRVRREQKGGIASGTHEESIEDRFKPMMGETQKKVRRAACHWWLRGQDEQDDLATMKYDIVLDKLTASGDLSNLLAVEKMWTQYAVNQRRQEQWKNDPAVSHCSDKKLSAQIAKINKLMIEDQWARALADEAQLQEAKEAMEQAMEVESVPEALPVVDLLPIVDASCKQLGVADV